MRRVTVAALVVCGLAAALPGAALAHARLVGTEPKDGAVLARSPAAVRVVFDDAVRPGRKIAAVGSDGASVQAGPARLDSGGRVLVIPLKPSLPDGDYTARWDVVSDDGHELSGVVAFGVGLGRGPPVAALTADSGVAPRDLLSRWLLFAGLLLAAGNVAFRLLVWPGGGREALRSSALLLFVGFALAFAGASAASHGGSDTRYGLVNDIATVVAAAGGILAALAYIQALPILWLAAATAAVVLLPMPTLAGHALDAGQSALAPVADLVHVGAAAVWLGVLASLALVVPRAARALEPEERSGLYARVVPRASAVALVAVALLSAAGVLRAIEELASVDQLWTTGYGRTLVVKSILLVLLVAAGWWNRSRIVPALERAARALDAARLYARLRRNVLAELAGFALVVVAVALLTALPPGTRAGAAPAPAPAAAQPPAPAPLPPAGAFHVGGQLGDLAVGVAAEPGADGSLGLTTTVLGPDGAGARGLDVAVGVDGPAEAPTRACGSGCYAATVPVDGQPRRVAVRVGGPDRPPRTISLALGAQWPPPSATALVRRAERTFRGLDSVTTDESVESKPGNRVVSRFQFVAPDRMTYQIRSGAQAIVIGPRRWDRASATEPWAASPQEPLNVPSPPWSDGARDARLLGTSTLRGRPVVRAAFLDPVGPAWFTISVDPKTGRTLDVRMTAASHFMRLRYSGFDAPVAIRPPR